MSSERDARARRLVELEEELVERLKAYNATRRRLVAVTNAETAIQALRLDPQEFEDCIVTMRNHLTRIAEIAAEKRRLTS